MKKMLGCAAGLVVAAIAACTAESGQSSPSPSPSSSSKAPESDDGGFANGCSPAEPIRYSIGPTGDPLGPNTYDACEALPTECATADAGVIDGAITDTAKTCKCVVAHKDAVNDAGQSSCPGRGPIYCDVLKDNTLNFRCAPP